MVMEKTKLIATIAANENAEKQKHKSYYMTCDRPLLTQSNQLLPQALATTLSLSGSTTTWTWGLMLFHRLYYSLSISL